MSEGGVDVETAIDEFRKELESRPRIRCQPLSWHVSRRSPAMRTRLAPLELAARSEDAPPQAFHYLGQCQLALDRPAEAIRSFEAALSPKRWRRPGAAREPPLSARHRAPEARRDGRSRASLRGSGAGFREPVDGLARAIGPVPRRRLRAASRSRDLSLLRYSRLAFRVSRRTRAIEIDRRMKGVLARAYFNLGSCTFEKTGSRAPPRCWRRLRTSTPVSAGPELSWDRVLQREGVRESDRTSLTRLRGRPAERAACGACWRSPC